MKTLTFACLSAMWCSPLSYMKTWWGQKYKKQLLVAFWSYTVISSFSFGSFAHADDTQRLPHLRDNLKSIGIGDVRRKFSICFWRKFNYLWATRKMSLEGRGWSEIMWIISRLLRWSAFNKERNVTLWNSPASNLNIQQHRFGTCFFRLKFYFRFLGRKTSRTCCSRKTRGKICGGLERL